MFTKEQRKMIHDAAFKAYVTDGLEMGRTGIGVSLDKDTKRYQPWVASGGMMCIVGTLVVGKHDPTVPPGPDTNHADHGWEEGYTLVEKLLHNSHLLYSLWDAVTSPTHIDYHERFALNGYESGDVEFVKDLIRELAAAGAKYNSDEFRIP